MSAKAAAGGLKKMVEAAVNTGIREAKCRIFGYVQVPPGARTAQKLLSKPLIGHKVASWYPHDIRFDDPKWIAEREAERLKKLEMKKRRGKGPPKKGQGRRATKRK